MRGSPAVALDADELVELVAVLVVAKVLLGVPVCQSAVEAVVKQAVPVERAAKSVEVVDEELVSDAVAD